MISEILSLKKIESDISLHNHIGPVFFKHAQWKVSQEIQNVLTAGYLIFTYVFDFHIKDIVTIYLEMYISMY